MAGVVRFALRHSRLVIGGWIAVVVLCAGLGLASGNAFKPTDLLAPGSESERWAQVHDAADFGVNLNILLTGPRSELRRQGEALTARLREVPKVRVVSPFDEQAARGRSGTGQLTELTGNSALLTVDVKIRPDQPIKDAVPPVREAIDATVSDPVAARMTGLPAIVKGLADGSYSATRSAELIAVPLLLIVLLLVFRSPVAAAIPGALGLGTVVASSGIVQALATLTNVDQLALNLASMMGLALGVDYALLLVSRYREHRREDRHAVEANIEAATLAAGRTIAVAAILLVSVMAAAALLSVGPLLKSAGLAIAVVAVFSALSAIVAAPALLLTVDPWLERWRLPARARQGTPWFAGRQPVLVPLLALIALLALAAPSLGIAPGAPDVRQLPPSAAARIDYEQISKVVGPGFGSVFDVTIQSRDDRPVTTARSLATMARLERKLRADPGVADVFGPGQLTRLTDAAADAERGLSGQDKGLARLDRGLSQAADGSRRAGEGAGRLHNASGEAQRGAQQLAGGLRSTTGGSEQLIGGVGKASGGSEELARESARASVGAGRLSEGLQQAKESSGGVSSSARVLKNDLQTGSDQLANLVAPLGTAEQQLAAAWRALHRMTTGRGDPQFQAALQAVGAASTALSGRDPASGDQIDPRYEGVGAGVADADGQFSLGLYLANRMQRDGRAARRNVGRLAAGATQLDRGLRQLAEGGADLSGGLEQLSAEGEQLPPGLRQLTEGAARLAGGVGELERGAGELAGGLGGSQGGGQLTGGLERMASNVSRQRRSSQAGALQENSPGLFDSGLFPLAMADGTPRSTRDRAQLVLDMTNGGRTARIMVVPAYASNDARLGPLHDRVRSAAHEIEGRNLEVSVGGPGASLREFKDTTSARLPLLVVAFALISFLILMAALRAVPLAALCVVLNLLTVGVTFGVMQLGFGGADPLLGGPGYVDVISLSATLAVVFALSIDYQVFLLARIREEYKASGSNERALTAAIGSTASVITGAAAIMVAVFVAFSTSDYIAMRTIGVGLAVAVFLDATVVRLVLLPAAMRLIGERTWWLPTWLDRRMPNFSL